MSSSFQKSTIVRFATRRPRPLPLREVLAPGLGGRVVRDLSFTVPPLAPDARCRRTGSRSASPRSAPCAAARLRAGPVVYLVHGWAGRGSQLAASSRR